MQAVPSPDLALDAGAERPAVDDATRALVIRATGAAVLAGTMCALSPLSVALAFVIAGLIWWACHDLAGRERRWVLALMAAAVLVRVMAIGAIAYTTDPRRASFHSLYGDAVYALERSMWLRNALIGVPSALLDVSEAFSEYGRSIYFYPLAWLQVLFGPAPYALHLTSLIGYFAGAILLYRVVRSSYGRGTAFVGFVLILSLPTLLLWSITPLKESPYFAMASLALVATVRAVRTLLQRRWLAAAGAIVLGALGVAVAANLRGGGVLLTLGGLLPGLAVAPIFLHRRAVVAALLVAPIVAMLALRQPEIQERALDQIRWGAERHIGFVLVRGSNYRLLPHEFYTRRRGGVDMTPMEAMRYAVDSFGAFLIIPQPWAPQTRSDIVMVPQQVMWYLLVIFAVPGAIAGLRRDPLLTCLLLSMAATGAVVVALTSGNIGTLIRHRDMIVPFVIWLGALGTVVTVCRWAGFVAKEGQ